MRDNPVPMPTPAHTDHELSVRERAQRLEDAMISMPQVACPVRNYFAPGMYAREITIPAGVVLVGAVHKVDNLVVLSKGRLELMTPEGTVQISAPHTLMCRAGSKNAAVALEDAVWTNFFATTETDVDKLIELLTESKASDLLGGSTNRQVLTAGLAAEGDTPWRLD